MGSKFPEPSPLSTRTTQHQEAVKTVCQKMEPWWRDHTYISVLPKAAAKAETFLNSLPANPPSNPQTPTAQSQKTQHGHHLEEVNIRTLSPAPRARETGPAVRRAGCAEKTEPERGSADTLTPPPLPPLHPQLPAAAGALPLQFCCDGWRLQG